MKFSLPIIIWIGFCLAGLFLGCQPGSEPANQTNSETAQSREGSSSAASPQEFEKEKEALDATASGADGKDAAATLSKGNPSSGEPSGYVVISEVQPSNAGEIVDQSGHCPDWIELWNPAEVNSDLSGWFLTDDLNKPRKWQFPKVVVSPGSRLLVYASGLDVKDTLPLETNFRLGASDQYVALIEPDGRTTAQIMTFDTHSFRHGISFGLVENGSAPMLSPTPGKENTAAGTGLVAPVVFSKESQLFDSTLQLKLSCETKDATIIFTTDGSLPEPETAQVYEQPLTLDRSTVIRAIATAPMKISSAPVAKSFLHIDSLLDQTQNPDGFPELWNETDADYEMDSNLAGTHRTELEHSLGSLPMVSVIVDQELFFGLDGIYSNTWERGFDWEVPASVEMFRFNGASGFTATAGIRISGNESRKEGWKKHSLRLNFRARYGDAVLKTRIFEQSGGDQFSTLVLRSTDDSWVTHDSDVRKNAQYIRDQWARDTHRSMGSVAARGRFVHVAINGLYWGVYNLVERPDDEFLAHQLGGKADDYVVLRSRVREIEADQEGEAAWNAICELAQKQLVNDVNYDAICRHLDVESFIDYCLVYLYAGGEDWPLNRHNNMKSYCQRGQISPMKFLVWDADNTFASGWNNDDCDYVLSIKSRNNPKSFETVFNALSRNESFRKLIEARLEKWSAEGGPLNDVVCQTRYRKLLESIEPALLAESARWGDVQSETPYSPMGTWQTQKNRILEQWFSNRAGKVRDRLREYWDELNVSQ